MSQKTSLMASITPLEGVSTTWQKLKIMDGMLSKADSDYASNPDINWSFTKFLLNRKGRVVARYEPTITPEEMVTDIWKLL